MRTLIITTLVVLAASCNPAMADRKIKPSDVTTANSTAWSVCGDAPEMRACRAEVRTAVMLYRSRQMRRSAYNLWISIARGR